jgi:hypothetical protein
MEFNGKIIFISTMESVLPAYKQQMKSSKFVPAKGAFTAYE